RRKGSRKSRRKWSGGVPCFRGPHCQRQESSREGPRKHATSPSNGNDARPLSSLVFFRMFASLIQPAMQLLVVLTRVPHVDRRVFELLVQDELRLLKQVPGQRDRLGRREVAVEALLGLPQRVARHHRVALLGVLVVFRFEKGGKQHAHLPVWP